MKKAPCFWFLFLLLARTAQAQTLTLSPRDHVVDLTRRDWDFVAHAPDQKPAAAEVLRRTDWQPIRVGQRWEMLGHPELAEKTVWVKLTFRVAELKGQKIGFFATMIDDEGAVYLNGASVGTFKYLTGGKVPHPVDVELTKNLVWDGENTLLVEIRDVVTQRMGGIIGSACLYKTLPHEPTAAGGIRLLAPTAEPLAVLLHQGDARLTQGTRQTFDAPTLAALHTPPSILRQDELVIVAPAKDVAEKIDLRVDLETISPTTTSAPLSLKTSPLPTTVGQYDLLRIPLDVSGTFTNPFDPKQISVYAVIETPAGRIEKVAAAFGQDFEPVTLNAEEEILLPVRGNPWKLYYRPREQGVHRVEVFAQDRSGLARAVAGSFTATPSPARGYLRKSTVEPRLFQFDNGEPYYGRGPSGWFRGSRFLFGGNIRWVPFKLLDAYYARKGANGSNFEYLATFHFGSLYLKDGFIDQHVAWKLEQSLRSMERHGLYWIVFHDGVLRSFQNGFDTLPYSTAQGGPCRTINEVYTHPVALEMQKNELRYLVSRMADSPSLWVWNCGDESQPGTKFSNGMVRDWLKELHGYIRQTDVYGHSHSIGEYENALLNGGDVVLLGDWYYHNNNRGDEYDQRCNGEKSQDGVGYSLCLQEKFKDWKTPVVNIEGGICQWENFSWLSGEKYKRFPEAIDFHQHLWLSLFTKMAAGGTEWLNQVVDEKRELYHAKAVETYLKGEPLTATFHESTAPLVSDPGLRAFGLQTDAKSLVWVDNRAYTWHRVGVLGEAPVAVKKAVVRVPVRRDGAYRVEIWDTRRGTVTAKTTLKSAGKMVAVPLPDVDKDLALKVSFTQNPTP